MNRAYLDTKYSIYLRDPDSAPDPEAIRELKPRLYAGVKDLDNMHNHEGRFAWTCQFFYKGVFIARAFPFDFQDARPKPDAHGDDTASVISSAFRQPTGGLGVASTGRLVKFLSDDDV